MSDNPKRYPIRNPEDFLAIPRESLDAALFDFCSAIRTAYDMRTLLGLAGVATAMRNFEFIDDGKHDMNVRVHVTEPKP